MTDFYSRFNNMNTYFTNLVEKDIVEEYSTQCAQRLAEEPIVQEIGYNPFIPLSEQPDCYENYFNTLEQLDVSTEAKEYLPTRSWFMQGKISAPMLLMAALMGLGEYVEPRVGDLPRDLYYIIHTQ